MGENEIGEGGWGDKETVCQEATGGKGQRGTSRTVRPLSSSFCTCKVPDLAARIRSPSDCSASHREKAKTVSRGRWKISSSWVRKSLLKYDISFL